MGFELLTKEELIDLLRERVAESQEFGLTSDALRKREELCRKEYDRSCVYAKELYDWFVELCEAHGTCRKFSEKTEWRFPLDVYKENEPKMRELVSAQQERNALFEKWMTASKEYNDFVLAKQQAWIDEMTSQPLEDYLKRLFPEN